MGRASASASLGPATTFDVAGVDSPEFVETSDGRSPTDGAVPEPFAITDAVRSAEADTSTGGLNA